MSAQQPPSVIVVGAGPAGLAVGALLRHAGVRPLLLEHGEQPGWSWRRHDPWLVLHTPRASSELPRLRFGAGSRYPTRDEMVDYLDRYRAAFDLEVRTRTQVLSTRRTDSGAWRLETSKGPLESRAVVLATGAFRRPRRPELPGSEDFAGQILHSSELGEPQLLVGKRVLVVGGGNTGCDLAFELARLGVVTTISVRRPIFALPLELAGFNWRTLLDLAPTALASAAGRLGRGPRAAVELTSAALWSRLARRRFAGAKRAGLPLMQTRELAAHWRSQRPPVTSERALDAIARGEIAVVPELVSLEADTATFRDVGARPTDVVVLATGFEAGLRELTGTEAAQRDPGAGMFLCGFQPALREIGRSAREVADRILSRPELISPAADSAASLLA